MAGKKISALLLLVIFIFNTVGAGLTWLVIIRQHRLAEKPGTGHVVTFNFTVEEFNAVSRKNKGEIVFGGKHFDVLAYHRTGSTISVSVLQDHKEDRFFDELKKQDENNSLPPGGKNSVKKSLDEFVVAEMNLHPVAYSSFSNVAFYTATETFPHFDVLAPPPRLG
jgi:hypothetical protein